MGGSVSLIIKTNGRVIPDELLVVAVECNSQLSRTSIAHITFSCSINEADDPTNAVTHEFIFGTEVIIEAGYDGYNKAIFTGLVSAQRVVTDESNNLLVIITCKGKETVIVDDTTTAALTLTYGENIISLDFSADRNAALTAGNLKETNGVVKFQGTSAAKTGNGIEMRNIGDAFNKTYLATGITHYIENGNWTTEADLNLKESL